MGKFNARLRDTAIAKTLNLPNNCLFNHLEIERIWHNGIPTRPSTMESIKNGSSQDGHGNTGGATRDPQPK